MESPSSEPADFPELDDDVTITETLTQEVQKETTGSSPRNRRRVRKLVRNVFGGARRGAQTLLTPLPQDTVPAVPPLAVSTESKLLRHSPFAIGFYGAIGVLVAIFLASAVMQVQGILILVIMALFLALGLSPAVDFLARRRVPRGLAVFMVTLTALGVIALGFTALVPILTEQTQALVKNLPGLLNNLRDNPQIADWDKDYNVIERVRTFLTSGTLIQNLFGGIWGAGRILANVVFSLIMILVLTIYFLASLPSIKEIIYHLAPATRRPRMRYLADEIFRGVSGYITGMFFIVTVASVASFIFMNIAGLGQYSLALAFVVALFCFIPIIGSSLAMVAVAIVGFATSPTIGIVTIIYFLVYQQFDAYVLYPNILKRTVKVPSALVILSAIIGGTLLGIIGAVIAIPTTAALLLLYREVVQPHLDAS